MLGHQANRLAVNDAKKAVGNSQRLQASKKVNDMKEGVVCQKSKVNQKD